jgi:hypothetical protein
MEGFVKWFKDGNACKIGKDKYLEQTTQYKKVFTFAELKEFYRKEYLSQ